MIAAQYDIFRKHETGLIWIEAAHDLTAAKTRMRELAEQTGGEYVVYDHRAKRIVATRLDNEVDQGPHTSHK
jgi:hypothetical protein